MALYAIADLHLSLDGEKPMDIFMGWSNYVQKLKENWEKEITNSDTVVIAGDISWATKLNEALKDFEFLEKLPGNKILIKGNHDYWWQTKNKMNTFFKDNKLNSFSILYNSAIQVDNICVCGTKGYINDSKKQEDLKIRKREAKRLEKSIEEAERRCLEPIVFLHYPPIYCGNKCEEILDVLISKKIKKCYYGHIHGDDAINKATQGKYMGIEFKLISCDYLEFKPIICFSKNKK